MRAWELRQRRMAFAAGGGFISKTSRLIPGSDLF
jgi:hypothetical protein